ncbi:M81 family metallopeptidase [Anaerorhabdus sp.]|uniref:M81 family metallopeptidase n=1 Tax=Anaerorhabdus sp. TaxID=1872524 RepID=UPI002FC8773F
MTKKIMVGQFITESNERNPKMNDVNTYDIQFGDECIDKMQIRDIFEDSGFEIIPSIYAVSGASGVCKRNTFDYIESCFVETAKEHRDELDGIYLMLHGASKVEGIGSGDHHILWALREIVGPYVPITVACDPHGNGCKEYIEQTTAIRSYRESPHTDARDTWRKMAKMCIELVNDRQNIHSVYRKLPLILGGEQSVSADEPVRTINIHMDDIERNDPRVRSVSWHVGYLRHDTAVAGCYIVVVPQNTEDQEYCEKVADDLAKYVWDKRNEFHYTGTTAKPDEALNLALKCEGKPFVITDSGDNTTSGSTGWNTYVLRQFLALDNLKKKVLFASICDPKCYDSILDVASGEDTTINLGVNYNDLSSSVTLDVTVKSRGNVIRPIAIGSDENAVIFGKAVVVNVKGTNIDIIITNHRQSYAHDAQFRACGINDWKDYDIVIVKQGYIFPELKENCKDYVMSLTDGATPQNTKTIPFKLIMRPMFPIDNI